ncbi:hypothetical protein BDW22DRAFT_1351026 [Trametopsis cervina]|nr:hypothetical protein BDW22DRAFT_1351026 [Trametopsis cervina]
MIDATTYCTHCSFLRLFVTTQSTSTSGKHPAHRCKHRNATPYCSAGPEPGPVPHAVPDKPKTFPC